MISLKSFLPVLSENTGLSVTALYERQRALVRLGLLPAPTKSGRNSGGAMATPGTVGIVLLSVLITDRLSEMDERIQVYLQLKPDAPPLYPGHARPECCYITGQPSLYRALQVLLSPERDDLVTISVDRKRQLVHLTDADPEGRGESTFGKCDGGWRLQHLVTFKDLFGLAQDLWLCQQPAETRVGSIYGHLEFG